MEYLHILNGTGLNIGSTLFLLLPVCILIFFFLHYKKKRDQENQESNRFGRRGQKDHIWQILKEYLKKKNKSGCTIEVSYTFERPHPSDFHNVLVRGLTHIDKQEAKRQNIKYQKVKYPKRIDEIEDYFDALTQETLLLNQGKQTHSHKVESLRDSLPKTQHKRKRYVVLFKTKQKDQISPWSAIEVELVKQTTKEGKEKDVVVINKELNVEMEMKWISPLLQEKIEEKLKKQADEEKRQRRKEFFKFKKKQ